MSDYRPVKISTHKIKKTNYSSLKLELSPNPDILAQIALQRKKTKSPKIVVGFAAESRDLIKNAQQKLQTKGLDLIVANDITQPNVGFNTDTNQVTLIDKTGRQKHFALMTKVEVGYLIINEVIKKLR